jgi:hypothetical protein
LQCSVGLYHLSNQVPLHGSMNDASQAHMSIGNAFIRTHASKHVCMSVCI